MNANEKPKEKLEELFTELEAVILNLENREISLEDAFACYQKGMGLLKQCNDKIDRIEKQVLILEEGELHEF